MGGRSEEREKNLRLIKNNNKHFQGVAGKLAYMSVMKFQTCGKNIE